jgi:glucose-1-phosphate thymidylyltransferase
VNDPQRYGIVEFDKEGTAISIEEKPELPKSNFAVPGIYVYNKEVIKISKNLKPSARGELEITDVNREYLKRGQLKVEKIGRGVSWLDTGTPEALLQASNFFGVIEQRQGLKVGCIEEIAFRMKFISRNNFESLVNSLPKCSYREYLERILQDS